MKTRPLVLLATLSSTLCVGASFGQSGGAAGGAGAGAGGASAGTSAGASAAGANSATGTGHGNSSGASAAAGTSITGATGGTGDTAATGTPNMSPSTPSRSVLDVAAPGQTPGPGNSEAATALPPGLSRPASRAGVSSLSGLPLSEIPGSSPGTEPIGAQPAANRATTATTASNSGVPGDRSRERNAAARTPQPLAGAAQAELNPQIATGTGTTVVVPTPPPAASTEAMPPPTGDASQVWVPGHYSWVGGQWTWISGAWQRPPSAGAAWVPGNYDSQNKRWTEGSWQPGNAPVRQPGARRDGEPGR